MLGLVLGAPELLVSVILSDPWLEPGSLAGPHAWVMAGVFDPLSAFGPGPRTGAGSGAAKEQQKRAEISARQRRAARFFATHRHVEAVGDLAHETFRKAHETAERSLSNGADLGKYDRRLAIAD